MIAFVDFIHSISFIKMRNCMLISLFLFFVRFQVVLGFIKTSPYS